MVGDKGFAAAAADTDFWHVAALVCIGFWVGFLVGAVLVLVV